MTRSLSYRIKCSLTLRWSEASFRTVYFSFVVILLAYWKNPEVGEREEGCSTSRVRQTSTNHWSITSNEWAMNECRIDKRGNETSGAAERRARLKCCFVPPRSWRPSDAVLRTDERIQTCRGHPSDSLSIAGTKPFFRPPDSTQKTAIRSGENDSTRVNTNKMASAWLCARERSQSKRFHFRGAKVQLIEKSRGVTKARTSVPKKTSSREAKAEERRKKEVLAERRSPRPSPTRNHFRQSVSRRR